jgi:hypothetical protein
MNSTCSKNCSPASSTRSTPIAALLTRGQHRIEHLDDAHRRAKHETENLVAIFIEQELEHRIDQGALTLVVALPLVCHRGNINGLLGTVQLVERIIVMTQ